MKSFEENTHAFVVRVWLEPREIDGADPEWRGVIEHVPSGERRSLKDLKEIKEFIAPYLQMMGVEFPQIQPARGWQMMWKLKWLKRE